MWIGFYHLLEERGRWNDDDDVAINGDDFEFVVRVSFKRYVGRGWGGGGGGGGGGWWWWWLCGKCIGNVGANAE